MKKKFYDSGLRKRIFIIVCIIAIVNTMSLLLLYKFKIKPVFVHNNEVKKTIELKELKKEYSTLDDLKVELDRISKEYNTKFKLVDDNEKQIIIIDVKDADFFLFSDIVIVNDDVYILNAYLHRNFSVTSIIVGLIVFQIIVIMILMTSTLLATGKTIITPIERIVNDIKAYKFGKKPVRVDGNSELAIIQNEFVDLVNSLEEEKNEQNRIIASISHDIKTPLTSIMGYSSLMDDESLSKKEIREYSIKINEKAKHIKNILGTFDDYLTSYDNKKLKLVEIMIKDIVNDLNADYKIELESKNIAFNVMTRCDNAIIKVDILKLKRIFSNIISNSLRYVSCNGRIDVEITRKEKKVLFSIRDNGPGIDESIIDKVFAPFFTTDKSRKISGLGLSICKEFVEAMGGEILVRNDAGLVIEFTIPLSNRKLKKVKFNKF